MKNYIYLLSILLSTFSIYTSASTPPDLIAQARENAFLQCISNTKDDCVKNMFNCSDWCSTQIKNDTLRCYYCAPCHYTNKNFSNILQERYPNLKKSCCEDICFPDQGPFHVWLECAACLPCLRISNPKLTVTQNSSIIIYSLSPNNNCCQNCMFHASMLSNCVNKYSLAPIIYAATFQCCYKEMRKTKEIK